MIAIALKLQHKVMDNYQKLRTELATLAKSQKLLLREPKLIKQQIEQINNVQAKLDDLHLKAIYKPNTFNRILEFIGLGYQSQAKRKLAIELTERIYQMIIQCEQLKLMATFLINHPNLLQELTDKHKCYSLTRQGVRFGNLFAYVHHLEKIITTSLDQQDSNLISDQMTQIVQAKEELKWIKLDINQTDIFMNITNISSANIYAIINLVALLGEYISGIGFNELNEVSFINYQGKQSSIKSVLQEISKLILKIDSLLLKSNQQLVQSQENIDRIPKDKKISKKSSPIFWLVALLIIAVVVFGGWYQFSQSQLNLFPPAPAKN